MLTNQDVASVLKPTLNDVINLIILVVLAAWFDYIQELKIRNKGEFYE